MDIASYVKTARSVITANSPVLLLGTTIAGVVTTGVLAAKAGYTARGIVDAERMNRVNSPEPPFDTFTEYYEAYLSQAPELTIQEKAQLTWLRYATAGISGAGTIAAAVGTHTVHTKRANAMAALYAVTSNKLDDMTEKAEQLLGPKKTQELQNQLGQKAIERNPNNEDKEVLILDDGTELCYDDWSGRYFMSSVQKLESVINDINRMLIDYGSASLNDMYEFMSLNHIPMGDEWGWSGEKIEGRFGAVTSTDGRPAIAFSFHPAPKAGLGRS